MAKDIPQVGDPVYIPSESYLTHGADDVEGGLTRILTVRELPSGGYSVTTEFDPVTQWNWDALSARQEQWARAFANEPPRQRPDLRPDFNKGWTEE